MSGKCARMSCVKSSVARFFLIYFHTSGYPKRFATSSKEMQVNERSMEEMLDDEHGSRV